ncbi:MAG TPA: serine/threonine-protein kinase [Sandaracinaceae bacterium]
MHEDRTGAVIGGQYRLVARLGGGGTGTVYRAVPVAGGRAVAVKLLDPRIAREPKMHTRFEREARALNGLEHPHLIRLLDFGMEDGAPYLVTELLEGLPLDRLLAQRPLPIATAFELGLGIVAGLAHAHAHGVLHRDLKPSNVFVAALAGGTLHPKILDFGLARFVDAERWGKHSTLTEEGAILGTPTYMAPEQGFGGAADARSDVYAAGVVLYELIAARPPFVHDSRAALIRMHAIEPVPPIGAIRRDLIVEPSFEAVLMRALAKDPKDRFENAGAMLRALEEVPDPPARRC